MASAATLPARKRPGVSPKRLLLHGFLIVTAILWLVPILWAAFTSFRPYADTAAHGYVSIPHSLSLSNYRHAWSQGQIPEHFWNSMLIAIPAIFFILLFASSIAFVVPRYSFWFNVPLLIFFMAANLLPAQVIITPLYELYLRIHLPTWLSSGSGLMYDSIF